MLLKRAALVAGALTIVLLAGVSGYLLVEVDGLRGKIESAKQANRQYESATTALLISLLPDPKEARATGRDISDLRADIRDIQSCLNSLGITPTTPAPDWILAQYSGALTCRVT